jgi:ketosteroid isomerase-like protein
MSQSNADVLRTGYDSFNRGDLNGILGLLDENVDWHEPDWVLGPGGRYRSGEDVKRSVFEAPQQSFESFRVEPREFVELGDRVLVLGRFVARPKGSGHEIEVPFAHLWTVRNGRIQRLDGYLDVKELSEIAEVQQRVAA